MIQRVQVLSCVALNVVYTVLEVTVLMLPAARTGSHSETLKLEARDC